MRWPFVGVGIVVLAAGLAAWHAIPAGVWHDDGVYTMVGRSLAEGDGLRYRGVLGDPPAVKFPPAYPAVVAGYWWLGGDLGRVTLLAETVNLLLLALAAALLAFALHRRARLPLIAASAAGVLSFLSGDVLRQALIPLSEPLFLAGAMGVLAAWSASDPSASDPSASDPDSPDHGSITSTRGSSALLAGLLCALVLTRSAAVAVVAGVAISIALTRKWGRLVGVVLPAVLAALGWGAWARRQADQIPEGMADILGPYSGWLTAQLLAAPGAFLLRLPGHVVDVTSRVAALALPRSSGLVMWVLGAVLLPLAVVGGRRLARDLPPLFWTWMAYLALLVLWPFADRRLVVPAHPLLVAALVAGTVEALERRAGNRAWTALAAVGFLWMAGYTVVSGARIADGWPASAYDIRTERLTSALEVLRTAAGPEAIVGAPELWPALHLHGGWTVIPSALFQPADNDAGGPVWGTPQEQVALWRSTRVDYLLLEQGGTIHGHGLDLLEAECPGATDLVASIPPQLLARIHWDRCG